MGQCQLCKKEVEMPFTCSYCGQTFCATHRLPENHRCPALPSLKKGKNWLGDKKDSIHEKTNTSPHEKKKYEEQTNIKPKTSYEISNRISSKINSFRRKHFSKYQYQRTWKRLKKYAFTLIEIGIIIVLSLPIYLTYIIDMQVSRDPLTSILLRNMVNKNVLIPTGIYFVSVLYFIYRKLTGYRIRFEWILVLSTSIISTWYIIRFITTISSISMIFQNKPQEIPDILFFYKAWALQLLSYIQITLKIIQKNFMEIYKR